MRGWWIARELASGIRADYAVVTPSASPALRTISRRAPPIGVYPSHIGALRGHNRTTIRRPPPTEATKQRDD
jgi:hypothetical protein